MHFEILVEDLSGKKALDILVPKIIGDDHSLKTAYPNAKNTVLTTYINDTICGTWERLADALVSGGASALIDKGRQAVGKAKSEWAESITPHMNVNNNASPSFAYFREKMRELAGIEY